MTNPYRKTVLSTLGILLLTTAWGQAQVAGDRVTVPFSDPTRPGMVKASVLNGGITVKAYEGKDVIVEAHVRDGEKHRGANNMRRIPMTSTGLSVEEENNQVNISTDSTQRTIDLTISVPTNSSLILRSVNDGDIVVTGVSGEIDVNNVNGNVTLARIAGNAIAHALNGKVLVTFTGINAKPMAFSSMNGDIDVTFPATLKANINLTNNQGDVYSDFDVTLQPTAPKQIVGDGRTQGGKYRVKIDKTVRGMINGGGPEMQFKNFNGDIFIRKAGGGTPAAAKE
ncbi:MAG TPA: DUF4097 family beta strand repeat-containing protein [Terriglobales bacterium]|nr:DUF4097 family beta strand repeat-containing protein [Terriglobales bacterium]